MQIEFHFTILYTFSFVKLKNNTKVFILKRNLVLFIILPFLCCKAKKYDNIKVTSFNQFPIEIEVDFENLFLTENNKINGLFLGDSTLYMSNSGGLKDHYFFEYSLSTNKIKGKYLMGGRKTGQSLGGYTFGLHKKRLLWLYDIPINKIVTVDVKQKFKDSLNGISDYKLTGDHRFAALLDNNQVLLYGFSNSKYKIQRVNIITGKIVSEYGLIEDVSNGVPINAWKTANQGFLIVKPGEDKVVIASIYSDQIEIFDLFSKKSKIIKGPDNTEVKFKLGKMNNSIIMDDDTNIYFNNCGVGTSKYIYLLHSGENFKKGKLLNEGKCIYVYDWNGVPKKVIKLDRYIRAFTVSKNDSTIFGFDKATGYIIKSKSGLQ